MVLLRDNSMCGDMPRADRALSLSNSVFLEARDLFHAQEALRTCAIPLTAADGTALPFSMVWKRNLTDELPPDVVARFPLHASDFWDYSMEDGFLDFELLERGDVFLFEELEEYSFALTRLIRAYYPDKYIFFKDPKAAYFFEKTELLRFIRDDSEFYSRFSYLISRSIVEVSTAVMSLKPYDPIQFLEKRYTSLELMTSLFWAREIYSYGDKNPDKIFCVIKSPLGMQGLADMSRYPLYRAEIASQHGGNQVIPVIDLSVPDDGNQFNGGSGENIWTMFFEQLTDIPLEEIHRSRNVILAWEHQLMFNPYLVEEFYYEDWALMFRKFLRYNQKTRAYIDQLEAEVVPENPGRVLGIIGRGTNYNSSQTGGFLGTPLDGPALLGKARQLMTEKGFDRIFLATEDQSIFDTFAGSDLANRMFFVPQPRIDYSDSANNDKLLVDIYAQEKRDGYQDTLRYLGILDILAKRCDALIATVDCGAYHYAIALNDGRYEFAHSYASTKQS